jgi:hypothetical protein
MEDYIFGPKQARHFNTDNSDFDLADNNDNIPSNIEILEVENIRLNKQKNYTQLNRSDLMKLPNLIILKLPIAV